jgi:hypothetical protein
VEVEDGHVLPGQHGENAVPHCWQKSLVALHTSLEIPPTDGHIAPGATQMLVAPLLLQQPVVHESLQQGCPVAPQAWQVVPWQTDALFEHVSPT